MSDDGASSVVVIALMGNPFSPHYAHARARGGADARPLDFCAMNVAVYGRGRALWALTERRVDDGRRDANGVEIGPSSIRWDGDALVIRIEERTSPTRRPVRGEVTFHPSSLTAHVLPLDSKGHHKWWPIAPHGRVVVRLNEPSLRFSGSGYLDANAGDLPLESSLAGWTWSRARTGEHETYVTYDVRDLGGSNRCVALRLDDRRGDTELLAGLASRPLAPTVWGLKRSARSQAGWPRVVRDLEDTPFYARALVETTLGGRSATAMHEVLSLSRFSQSWVRFLLGFRMGLA